VNKLFRKRFDEKVTISSKIELVFEKELIVLRNSQQASPFDSCFKHNAYISAGVKQYTYCRLQKALHHQPNAA
jgi:hypothetical protein